HPRKADAWGRPRRSATRVGSPQFRTLRRLDLVEARCLDLVEARCLDLVEARRLDLVEARCLYLVEARRLDLVEARCLDLVEARCRVGIGVGKARKPRRDGGDEYENNGSLHSCSHSFPLAPYDGE